MIELPKYKPLIINEQGEEVLLPSSDRKKKKVKNTSEDSMFIYCYKHWILSLLLASVCSLTILQYSEMGASIGVLIISSLLTVIPVTILAFIYDVFTKNHKIKLIHLVFSQLIIITTFHQNFYYFHEFYGSLGIIFFITSIASTIILNYKSIKNHQS